MPSKPPSHDDDLRRMGIVRPRAEADQGYNRMRRGGGGPLALLERLRSSARWQRFRAELLKRTPLCVVCEREGRVTAGSEIDHITPARTLLAQHGPEGFFDATACQVLCHPCHARKSAAERTPR